MNLGSIRILDPACGSGAFLIEAFDQLHTEYERTNERVRELRGFAELFDLDRKILQENLYGVDLNEEAVHIAKLSLWIKTAVQGKELTSLDHTLRVGNSIVADSTIDPRAFDWKAEFQDVFEPERGDGGFDVVDRQSAVHSPGMALADQALLAIAVRGLSRDGGPLCLLLRAWD